MAVGKVVAWCVGLLYAGATVIPWLLWLLGVWRPFRDVVGHPTRIVWVNEFHYWLLITLIALVFVAWGAARVVLEGCGYPRVELYDDRLVVNRWFHRRTMPYSTFESVDLVECRTRRRFDAPGLVPVVRVRGGRPVALNILSSVQTKSYPKDEVANLGITWSVSGEQASDVKSIREQSGVGGSDSVRVQVF